MYKNLNISVLLFVFSLLLFTTTQPAFAQNCTTMGDVNNDGLTLSVADNLFLGRFLLEKFSSLPVPYKADLNGDCVIDWKDVKLYELYFINGVSAFPNGLPVQTCCTVQEYCCTNIRGNVDYDPNDIVDISDLNYLADFMFNNGPDPICPAEANMDGSGVIDISDLNYLVDFMFNNGPDPVSCQ